MASYIGLGGDSAAKPIEYSGLNISTSKRDLPIPLFGGLRRLPTNAIWYNDFQKHSGSSKGKGGGGKGGGQYTYSAAVALALCEGTVDSINLVWAAATTSSLSTLAKLGFTFYDGSASQTPEPFVVSKYPAQAESYAYTSYLFNPQLDLGSSAEVPDNQFECQRTSMYSYVHTSDGYKDPSSGTVYPGYDILMTDWITDWLTNPQYGMGFSSGDMGSVTQLANMLRAYGIFHSPLLNSQEKGTQVLDRYAQESYAWIYWDGTTLQFYPLGDATVTANGVTFTPQNDVAYSLGPNDFIEPLKVNRVDPIDAYNRTIIDVIDRTLGYVSNPLEYRDDTLVDLYGLRDNTSIQGNDICDPLVGQIVVDLIGKRAAHIRNTYQFKTNYRFILCIPGTILELTDPNIGITTVPVRVTSVEEDEKGVLSFEAEEYPGTVGHSTTMPSIPLNTATTPDIYADPGNVNTPAIIEPDSAYTGGVPRVIIAASGGANWGGCQVHISFDGLSYSHIGDITAAAAQGLLTATLPDHSGLDTSNTLSVDCTESLTTPATVTHADADANRTLSLVCAQPTVIAGPISVVPNNGELLSFGNTATTGTYSADLTYLPRGQYGTAHSAHAIGDQFTVVDVTGQTGSSITYDLPPQYVGQTIYVKLLSFNNFENSLQDISTVIEYQYTPTGLGYGTGAGGVPATPTGLAVASSVQSAVVTWAANAATDNVQSYDLYRAPGPGGSFGSASLVFTGLSLNRTDPALTAGGQYTYFLKATNAIGSSSPTAGVDVTIASTVVNQFGFGFDRDLSSGTLGADFVEFTINIPWTIIAGMGTSEVKNTGTAPSAQTDFDLQVNGVSVGTIRFAASSNVATFIKASDSAVSAGQTTKIVLPASLNGMTGRLFGSIVGTR